MREEPVESPPPEYETATLAGGCFWCLETVFLELKGVTKVLPGYSGGASTNPSYREVCTGRTGHAEAVQVTFNPGEIAFKDIVEIFFTIHDPTTLNRQGADEGTQYRSAIFYHDNKQKAIADEVIQQIDKSGVWDDPVVTEVSPFQNFFAAEEYHRDYYSRNIEDPYCRIIIKPKIAKLRSLFLNRLKKE